MKKLKKILFAAFTVAILSCLLCQPAFAAISESDVQAQVDAVGKEAVSGNVFIWFLCAIGFLKSARKSIPSSPVPTAQSSAPGP